MSKHKTAEQKLGVKPVARKLQAPANLKQPPTVPKGINANNQFR